MNNKEVVILNLGVGNIFSIKNACKLVGLNTIVSDDKNVINNSNGLIIPGVGSYKTAMDKIKRMKLDEVIFNYINTGKPVMGICLGMQLFFESSEEFGNSQGLAFIKGKVKNFQFQIIEGLKFPSTQIGWNNIFFNDLENKFNIYQGVENGALMYFANSYYVEFNEEFPNFYSEYGRIKFCSSYIDKNLYLFQFHPEKSGKDGMKIYKNFKNIVYK